MVVSADAHPLNLATQEYYYDSLYGEQPSSYVPLAEEVASTMKAVKLGQLFPAGL